MRKNVKTIEEALRAKLAEIGRDDLVVYWTNTGGGCMALVVETKGADRSEPYDHILITGEDVYVEEEYDAGEIIPDSQPWHFLTMGHYPADADGDMTDDYYVATDSLEHSIVDAAEFIDQISENWLTPVDHACAAVYAQLEGLSREDMREVLARVTESIA